MGLLQNGSAVASRVAGERKATTQMEPTRRRPQSQLERSDLDIRAVESPLVATGNPLDADRDASPSCSRGGLNDAEDHFFEAGSGVLDGLQNVPVTR